MGESYAIRPLDLGDPREVASLLRTFERVFAGSGARTRAEWSWTFEKNPAGARAFVAVARGEVVAQFAACPERVWIDGRERIFAQAVDSMVHPEHRAGLKRPGLFVETARACFAACGGRERDLVYYGLPVRDAWRIGHRFLDYQVVRTELALVRELDAGPASELPNGVERLARFDEQAKWLWDRAANEFGASAVRDAAFLNWRLCEHPTRSYRCLGARGGAGVLRGVAAWRRADFVLPDLAVIAEWLVPAGEPEVAEVLLDALVAEASAARARALVALVPPWHAWFGWFQTRDFCVHPTDYRMAAVTFDPRFDAPWLREHWWYQLADTDLV